MRKEVVRVVAGSRLERQRVVPSAGSTGWCLVESPDDESPSGPRNEEGHGRLSVSLLWGAALRSPSGREPLATLRLVKTGLRVRRTLHAET